MLSLASANALQSVRVASDENATRLVFDLSEAPGYNVFTLGGTGKDVAQRVVVDLNGTHIVESFNRPVFANSRIRNLRYGSQSRNNLRIVLDVAQQVQIHSFTLGPSGQMGHRLVVDLEGKGQVGSGSQLAETVKQSPVIVAVKAPPARTSERPTKSLRDVVIAIDAGHGGKDPGAIGSRKTREKDVVLAVATRLNNLLEQEPGMRPVMTRKSDVFISLRERIEVAKKQKADVFISIHADAAYNKQAGGSSVYVLSQSGATSEAARFLAQRENSAYQIGDVLLADKDDDLASVLVDLAKEATINSSLNLAADLLENLSHVGKIRKTRVEQAGFVVLKSLDIPSVLVETAFISNPSEESRLVSSSYQQSMAVAIRNGLKNYFRTHAPPNSLLANLSQNQHVIREGETLSIIAQHYDVNLDNLRNLNALENDRIQVGQVLRIPTSDS